MKKNSNWNLFDQTFLLEGDDLVRESRGTVTRKVKISKRNFLVTQRVLKKFHLSNVKFKASSDLKSHIYDIHFRRGCMPKLELRKRRSFVRFPQ
jgi:hypothetical protein